MNTEGPIIAIAVIDIGTVDGEDIKKGSLVVVEKAYYNGLVVLRIDDQQVFSVKVEIFNKFFVVKYDRNTTP